ncbi:MAG: serine/threonine protein kinase, partial [bacterium]
AAISLPSSVVWDQHHNMYLSDQGNNRIRKIGTNGIIRTFAGGSKGFVDGTGPGVKFAFPNGTDAYPGGRIDVSADGLYIYVADTENNRVRRIELATQVVRTIAGTGDATYSGDGAQATAAGFNYPTDIACTPEGDMFVADSRNHVVRKIDADGVVTTVAGTGAVGPLLQRDNTDALHLRHLQLPDQEGAVRRVISADRTPGRWRVNRPGPFFWATGPPR